MRKSKIDNQSSEKSALSSFCGEKRVLFSINFGTAYSFPNNKFYIDGCHAHWRDSNHNSTNAFSNPRPNYTFHTNPFVIFTGEKGGKTKLTTELHWFSVGISLVRKGCCSWNHDFLGRIYLEFCSVGPLSSDQMPRLVVTVSIGP